MKERNRVLRYQNNRGELSDKETLKWNDKKPAMGELHFRQHTKALIHW